MALAVQWLGDVRKTDPRKLAFFTGRDQSQSLTGWWAMQFGTPNYAAHGGFCSVNMAAAGLYTFGGSFWEFGDTDWDHTRYFMLFGVAEDHASNPIKIGARQAQEARRQDRRRQPGAHGLQRHRRRMDRHQARHRRAVRRGAGARAAADAEDRSRLPGALHQCALAGDQGSRRGRRRSVRARRRRQSAWLRQGVGQAASARSATSRRLALSGSVPLADKREAVPVFQLMAERFLCGRVFARAGGAGDGHRGGHHSPDRRRAGACGVPGAGDARHSLDRLVRAAGTRR